MLAKVSGLLKRISGGREVAALGDQALVSGANFLTNLMMARSMGVREYGIFALAWMAVLFVNSFQWALVVSPMMSVGPKQEDAMRPSYYGAVVTQELFYALFGAAAVFFALHIHLARYPAWNFTELAWPLSFATMSYLLQDFVRRYFFSIRRAKQALLSDAVSYLTQLPILFWMLRRPATSTGAVLWVLGATSLAGFLVGWLFFEPIRLVKSELKQVALRHWRISKWMAPSAFMQWSTGSLFTLAATVFYGAAAAAVLRCSQNIVGIAHIWFLGLDNVVPAEAARRMHRDGVDAAFHYVKSIALRWGLITFAFLLVVCVAPSFWLGLLYGSRYAGYGRVLQLNAGLYMLAFFSGPMRAGLQALEYTAPIFWSYLAMTICSIVLSVPAVHWLGLNGALLGMIATQLVFQSIVGYGLLSRVRLVRNTMTSAPQA